MFEYSRFEDELNKLNEESRFYVTSMSAVFTSTVVLAWYLIPLIMALRVTLPIDFFYGLVFFVGYSLFYFLSFNFTFRYIHRKFMRKFLNEFDVTDGS